METKMFELEAMATDLTDDANNLKCRHAEHADRFFSFNILCRFQKQLLRKKAEQKKLTM